MLKKITVASLILIFSLSLAVDSKLQRDQRKSVKGEIYNDTYDLTSSKTPYDGTLGTTFDQSMNGYGWVYATTRKIATNLDPSGLTAEMVGTNYRSLEPAISSGTIGGMVGVFGADLTGSTALIYASSDYQSGTGVPGGRYPSSCGFINGYYFGMFNDYDLVGPSTSGFEENSNPMFTVGDATIAWDLSFWSAPERVEATDGGAVVPCAWTGAGDVVYDSATGMYYWTQVWGISRAADKPINTIVTGKTSTPADLSSWIWSDYNDMLFDTRDSLNGENSMGDVYAAYCKDIYGNGTGYGIIAALTGQADDVVENSLGNMVQPNEKLSYAFTTNWGADDGSGDWTPNWQLDDGQFYQVESKDLFDWYGEEVIFRDSIGWDDILEETIWDTTDVVIVDDPMLNSNITVVATEYNAVHLLIRVWPSSLDIPGSYWTMMGNDFRGGYYHVRGQISDTGVTWSKATMVAGNIDNYIDADDDGSMDVEYRYMNGNNMSISYGGFGQIYASWLDKPTSRPSESPFAGMGQANAVYIDDAYMAVSGDDGNTWQVDYTDSVYWSDGDIWTMPVGYNITNTSGVHEEGFQLSSNCYQENGELTLYAVQQSYDPLNLSVAENDDFACYNQFLNVWKITGTMTNGIEAEQVSLIQDFELMQNYPNPFNPSTEISFKIQNDAKVKLTVFNSNGETVASLVNGKMAKGLHSVNFNATKLNSGVYFYQLDVNGMKSTKKMVLAK